MTLHEASAVFLIIGMSMLSGGAAMAQNQPAEAGWAHLLMHYDHAPNDRRFWVVDMFAGQKALAECEKKAAELNQRAATVPKRRWMWFWTLNPINFQCAGKDEK